MHANNVAHNKLKLKLLQPRTTTHTHATKSLTTHTILQRTHIRGSRNLRPQMPMSNMP